MRYAIRTIALVAVISSAQQAQACSTHGLIAAAALDTFYGGSTNGVIQGSISIGTTIVPPTSSTVCTCGIGLGTTDSPLPRGVEIIDAAIVLVRANGSRTRLSAFLFEPSTLTSEALAEGGGTIGAPGTSPLFAGSTWFGFSSSVSPFSLPTLGPGEFTAMEFTFAAAEALLPLALPAQFAAGEGTTTGAPIFRGDHPAQYFTAANSIVPLSVPPPGDYNNNGEVDAADYVVWRKTLGQTGANPSADGNGNLQVDDGDFSVWRANFGMASSGPIPSLVPEPTASLIYCSGFAMLLAFLRGIGGSNRC